MTERVDASAAGHGLFVTGTDTGIGKTLVACAMLRALRRGGVRAVGMKPIAAGAIMVDGIPTSEDVIALNQASAVAGDPAHVNPYLFADPIAPHLAADDIGQRIDIERIRSSFRVLRRRADFVVVEGAGGLLVPVGPTETIADLIGALGLPVVLVVGMRLGCLNQALLTAEAMLRRKLPLAGWVANRVDPTMPRWQDNIDTLRVRLPAPLLGTVPHFERPQQDAFDGLNCEAIMSAARDAHAAV